MMDTHNQKPLITIGMTCFNAQDTITRALESAFAQDWPNLDIIIVDDCSTDNSAAVVQQAIKDHENARLIMHKENAGPAGARQTVLDNTNGEFLAFFDDDDEALPERLATQYERIVSYECESGAPLVACYASGKRIYPNDYVLEMSAIGSKEEVPKGEMIADYQLFYGKHPGVFYGAGTPTCSLMARTQTFKAAGGFDATFRRVEDVDFAISLGLAGGHFIGCPEMLFIQHATEGGDKSAKKNKDAEVQLAEKYKDYLKSVGRYEYAKNWPLIRYYHFKGQHGMMLWTLFKLFLRAPVKVTRHFFTTAPKRFLHERKMKKEQS